MTRDLSRRDFLKLTALGLLGLFLPSRWSGRALKSAFPADLQGRVAWDEVRVYDRPSREGVWRSMFWRDDVFPIAAAVLGEGEPTYNRIWYYVPGRGYVHSGPVQPVRTVVQMPQPVPDGGVLAEVTVPYTDAYWQPLADNKPVYRLYYATVHWVTALVSGEDGQAWYEIRDDKWDFKYYALARHLRLLTPQDVAPLSPDVPPEAKKIVVHLGKQLVMAFEYDRLVFAARAATGMGYYRTPLGQFDTFHKRPQRHMARGNFAAPEYDLPGVPWVCYITREGISFHGTYWHNDFGKPRSHGCINLAPQAALWLYRWTNPVVPFERDDVYREGQGTRVEIV